MPRPSSLSLHPTDHPTDDSLPAPPLPTPPRCEVPHFEPVRAGGFRHRRRRTTRQRMLAAGLAMTAAALATGIPTGAVRAAPAPGCPASTAIGAR
ncbi:hypothetical protein FCH28_36925 [Streptomyces piniterrae]|uniref:Uncharacterized protein n=1 Tax=Streptomyces piniterrae TaxID=2571125 RepID=A0A4U0MW84_9ACTN|nr:hypothetical protein [Streptomyces piniterrae]TJZ41424.1 hypothetical protein FCH28_36925 [Streptomyces piniterrae]